MFHEIKSSKDIQDFLEKTNWLHDGKIIDVQYSNSGITRTENGYMIDPTQTKLILHILVTSIWDAVVEIVFENLVEWQIQDYPYYIHDIIETSVRIDIRLEQNWIIWSENSFIDMDELKNGTYAIARSMRWRIVE